MISKTTLVEEIIKEVFKLINSQGMKAGDRFPSERELTETWHVSRTALREAMKALSYSNVVTIRSGDGTYLNDYSQIMEKPFLPNPAILVHHPYIGHLIESRRVVESGLIKLAMERATDEDILRIERALDNLKPSRSKDKYSEEDFRADMNFHFSLSKASQNDLLCDIFQHFLETFTQLFAKGIYDIPKYHIYEEHESIFEAFKKKNYDKTIELLDLHLKHSRLLQVDTNPPL